MTFKQIINNLIQKDKLFDIISFTRQDNTITFFERIFKNNIYILNEITYDFIDDDYLLDFDQYFGHKRKEVRINKSLKVLLARKKEILTINDLSYMNGYKIFGLYLREDEVLDVFNELVHYGYSKKYLIKCVDCKNISDYNSDIFKCKHCNKKQNYKQLDDLYLKENPYSCGVPSDYLIQEIMKFNK